MAPKKATASAALRRLGGGPAAVDGEEGAGDEAGYEGALSVACCVMHVSSKYVGIPGPQKLGTRGRPLDAGTLPFEMVMLHSL